MMYCRIDLHSNNSVVAIIDDSVIKMIPAKMIPAQHAGTLRPRFRGTTLCPPYAHSDGVPPLSPALVLLRPKA